MASRDRSLEGEPSDAAIRTAWELAPDDPDLETDLGYDLLDLDVVQAMSPDRKLMVLPRDEAFIEDDAYLVVDPEDMQ